MLQLSQKRTVFIVKMGSDPAAACIIRSGSPAYYRYEVIAGRENFLITDAIKNAAEEISSLLQNKKTLEKLKEVSLQDENGDDFQLNYKILTRDEVENITEEK